MSMKWVPGVGVVWESDVQRQIKATHDDFNAQARAFRFYEDGTESGSTAIGAENTNITRTITADNQVALRYSIQENGSGTQSGAATDDWTLEFDIDGGGFNPVTAASTGVRADTGSTLTDGGATTNRGTDGISDGTGTFISGEIDTSNGEITDWQLTGDNFSELLWAIILDYDDLTDGNVIQFRVLYNGSATADMDNDVTPQITIDKDVPLTEETVAATDTGVATVSTQALHFVTLAATATPSAGLSLPLGVTGWRFYSGPFGTEDTSDPLAAENTNTTVPSNVEETDRCRQFHFRVQIADDGSDKSVSTDDYQLQMSINGGAWTDVGTSTNFIDGTPNINGSVDGDPTTNRATNGITDPATGSFVAGEVEEASARVSNFTISAGDFTEHLYGLRCNSFSTLLTQDDTVDFRLNPAFLANGIVNYVPIPRLTIDNHQWDQDKFRFYEDGTESGSTAIADENTNINRDSATDPDLHIRIGWQETNGVEGSSSNIDDYQLQYSKNSGTWTDVAAASSNVTSFPTSGLTNTAATTQRLSNGTGSFVAGEQEENIGITDGRQLTANNYTEYVWAISLVDADLTDGDTLDFRVQRQVFGTAVDEGRTLTVTPRITVGAALAGDETLAATSTGVATLDPDALFFRTVSGTVTPSATVSPLSSFFRSIAATVTGVATTVARLAGLRSLAATATGVATLNKISSLARSLEATAAGVATITQRLTAIVSLAATSTGSATIARLASLFRTLAATVTGSATINRLASLFRTLATTATGVATLVRSQLNLETIAAIVTGSATLTRTATLLRTIAATVTGGAALVRVVTFVRTLAATSIGTATLNRLLLARRTLAATAAGVATLVEEALAGLEQVALAATATGVATVAKVATFFRAVSASVTGSAVLARFASLARSFAATVTGVAVLGADNLAATLVTLAATVAGVATATFTPVFSVVVSATATATATISRFLAAFRTLGATVTGVATEFNSPWAIILAAFPGDKIYASTDGEDGWSTINGDRYETIEGGIQARLNLTLFETIAATVTAVAAVIAGTPLVTRTLAAVATGVATISRFASFFRTISATATGAAVLDRLLLAFRVLAATVTGSVTLTHLLTAFRTLAAIATGSAALARVVTFFRTLAATVTGVATLAEALISGLTQITIAATATGVATIQRFLSAFRTLAATVTGGATLVRVATFFRTLAATVTGAASITATFVTAVTAITLAATCTGVATLLSTVTRFVEPFVGHGGVGMLDRAQTRWKRRAASWRRRR